MMLKTQKRTKDSFSSIEATAGRGFIVYLFLSFNFFLYGQTYFRVWQEENGQFLSDQISRPVEHAAISSTPWLSPNKIQHTAATLNLLLEESLERYRTLSFIFEAPVPIDTEDITLTTHISTNKLDVFLFQLKQWNGPASCAVYITSQEDIKRLMDFVSSNKEYLKQTSIHTMIESSSVGRYYPMNHLRNLALDNIQSDYFLAIDADFITDDTAHVEIKAELKKKQKFYKDLHNKNLYVLPAFEHFMPSELEKNNITVQTESPLPTTKPQLMQMIAENKTAPFHKYFRKGHGSTNYQKWYTDEENFSYPIKYELRFEPYVIGYKRGVARYWSGFRGFGFNKYSWLFELHHMGYKYRVVRRHFTIHKNHPEGGSGRKIPLTTRLEYLGFKRYMIEQYGVDPKELRDWNDHFGDSEWQKLMDFDGKQVLSEKSTKVGVWQHISNPGWEEKNPGWELLTNGTHYGKVKKAV
mmetsp:Transcript_21536/g.30421  ORF Transcript_21536/g.30421 Transcript_21536/m.30421 type:complete len:468 (-) Transcript_21536:104-1507(-)